MSGYGRTVLFTPPCVSFQAKKNGRHEADLSPAAAIYAAQTEAVQPPDDRTYSAEVTVFRRNLLHHRSARAEFPYTRPIILPLIRLFVKYYFRKNHKNFYVFSVISQNLFFWRKGRFLPLPMAILIAFGPGKILFAQKFYHRRKNLLSLISIIFGQCYKNHFFFRILLLPLTNIV